MARPGGKEVGRVNIRAVPDGTKFNKDLKVMLERVERTVTVSIPVAADTRLADSQLQRFQRNWNGQSISLGVAAATAGASAQLAYVSRTRIVPLIVRVSQTSLAKAATLIAALSGLRLTGDIIENVAKKLENLDRALPKAALVTGSVTSIVALVLSTLGGLVTLGGGLADILGLATALPGVLAGLAVGGTAFALALVDIKKQLGVLAPGFKRLQDQVSNNFWAVARRPIIDFVNATLPELRTGLALTSTAIGGWAATVVQSIQQAFGGGRITAMFAPLIQSIQIASTGALGFAQAIAVLGQVGGSYLPRLAQWVADLSNRLGAYLLQIEASGALQRVIESGITAAKQLGSSLASIVGILGGIESAAQSAGGGGLASFASVLASISDAVNSPAFQQTLSTLFVGAGAGAAGLAASLAPIGALIASLAPLLSGVLAGTGAVIGEVLGQIATALQSPAFSTGLAVFFEGLIDGVQAVAPALPALAAAFGTFLGFAGRLAGALGPVLGGVLAALAPIFTELLDAVQPLLPMLGTALVQAVQQLAPSLLLLVQSLAPLLPSLGQLAVDLLPPLVGLLQATAIVLASLSQLKPLVDAVAALAAFNGDMFAFAQALLSGASMAQLAADQLGGRFGPVLQTVAQVTQAVGHAVQSFFLLVAQGASNTASIWNIAWAAIGATFQSVWTGIVSFGRGAFNTLTGLLQGLINSIINGINGLTAGFRSALSAVGGALGINLTIGKIPNVSLPRLAIGADINPSFGGTAFIAGEGGRKETVTDWGRTNRLIQAANALASRALGAGASGEGLPPINITEASDAYEVGIEVIRQLQARRA